MNAQILNSVYVMKKKEENDLELQRMEHFIYLFAAN